jgi:hypothetical protein
MSDTISCPRCGCACRVQPHDHANCVQCFTSFRPSTIGQPFDSCLRCGQTTTGDATVCDGCRALERAPQGSAVRLFEPAPATMPGQTGMAL